MADVFLLKMLVLKLCGSPFPMLICGTFSVWLFLLFHFYSLLDPYVGEQNCSFVRSSEGHGREGAFMISCLLRDCACNICYEIIHA